MSGIAPRWEIAVEGRDVSEDVSADALSVSFEDHATDADMATLSLANPDNRWTDSPLFEQGNVLELAIGYGKALTPVFKGPITRPEPSFPQDGVPTLSLRAYDLSHLMRRVVEGEGRRSATTWQNVTDSDLAKQMAQKHGIPELDIEETTLVIPYVAQGNETDWAFLKRRAERIGFEVFVERDTFHFHAPRDSLAQVPGALEYRKNLRSFEVRLSVEKQVTKVIVKGWDAENKEPIVAIATGEDTVRSVLGEKAASDFVKEDFGEGAKILHDLVPRTVKEAEELARAYLKRSEYTLLQGSGSVVGDPTLKAKTLVEIAGVGERYSGTHYVTKVMHSIGDGGYTSEFECQRNAVS
jgi:phage protein D